MDREKQKNGKILAQHQLFDDVTLSKRNEVKEKISDLVDERENIEEILVSIEKYCRIILESL